MSRGTANQKESSESSEAISPENSDKNTPSSSTNQEEPINEATGQTETESATTNDQAVSEPKRATEIDLSQAEPLEDLTEETIRWLKPTRGKLPQIPISTLTSLRTHWNGAKCG